MKYPAAILVETMPLTVEVYPLIIEAPDEHSALGQAHSIAQKILRRYEKITKILTVKVGNTVTIPVDGDFHLEEE